MSHSAAGTRGLAGMGQCSPNRPTGSERPAGLQERTREGAEVNVPGRRQGQENRLQGLSGGWAQEGLLSVTPKVQSKARGGRFSTAMATPEEGRSWNMESLPTGDLPEGPALDVCGLSMCSTLSCTPALGFPLKEDEDGGKVGA
ncbi:hypothetical protein H1C71_003789 [Ictidomys tridecemlineatus]|nr:hypothetical protein H1C71_003789 [Ictidomys tridecemlineatus]